jgi:hypothetical protein
MPSMLSITSSRHAPSPRHPCHQLAPRVAGYLTFYHYNGWQLSDYHFNGDKYTFALDVVKEIQIYHFCLRGTPTEHATLDRVGKMTSLAPAFLLPRVRAFLSTRSIAGADG